MPDSDAVALPLPGPLAVLEPKLAIRVAEASRIRTYDREDEIVRQGARSGDIVVLQEGRVRVIAGSSSGRELLLAVLGPSDIIGELSAIDGGPHSASVVALEPVTCVHVPTPVFKHMMLVSPAFSAELLIVVGRRLRSSDRRLLEQAVEPTQARLCRRLLEIAARHSELDGDRLVVTIPLTQEQLATWIGATREATAKALGELRREGLIETGRGFLTIGGIDGLRERAA